MSKLGRFCDHFIEAGWLFALGLLPLYINFLSRRGYSASKAYLLRVIVVLMVTAWLIKLYDGAPERSVRQAIAPLWKNPLALPVTAYLFILVLTTLTSVAPVMSFNGSFLRLQGTYTMLMYIAVFCLMALNLRTREQFDRIITVLLLVSLPISLYGIVQELGWDPHRYLGTRDTLMWRVRSTLGNHLFLGGYLIMVMPWCAARMIGAFQAWRQGEADHLSSVSRVPLAAGMVLLQTFLLAAFVFFSAIYQQLLWLNVPVLCSYFLLVVWTTSLVDKLPPLAGVVTYGVLLALQAVTLALTQARGPWLAAVAGAILFGILISMRWGIGRLLGMIAGCALLVALFVGLLNIPHGPLESLKRYEVLRRLGSLSALEAGSIGYRLLLWDSIGRLIRIHPSIGSTPDPLAGMRLFIGYGPETLGLAIEKVLHPGLARGFSLVVSQDRAHNDLLQHIAESGLLGLAAFIWLLFAFYRVTLKALWRSGDRNHQLSLIALIAAVTAHLVELQTGLAVTVTRLFFWMFLPLGTLLLQPLPTAASPQKEVHSPSRSRCVAYILLTLVVAMQATPLKVGGISTGALLGLGSLLLAMIFASLDLGRLAGDSPAHGKNWWKHAITAGVAGLLIYHMSFRPMLADTFFTVSRLASRGGIMLMPLQQAATIQPWGAEYQAELGNALMRVGFGLSTQRPNLKPPKNFQPSALLARTLNPNGIFELGGEEALALADSCFQEAHRLQPLDSRHIFLRARLNHQWGVQGRPERLDLALRYYEEAAQLSPNRLAVLVNWAVANTANGKPADALTLVRHAQAMGHDSWVIHYTLALAYHQMGNKQEALKEAAIASRDSRMPEAKNLLQLLDEGKLLSGPLPLDATRKRPERGTLRDP